MASKNTKQAYFDRKAAEKAQAELDKLDLYGVFLAGTNDRVYRGSNGVPLDKAQQLSNGLVADTEVRLVRKAIA